MGEPRDPEPATESRTAPIVAAGTTLSPVQEAYSACTTHALGCPKCRDIDRDRCIDGDRLRAAYLEISNQAYRRLADETP